jgi:hypothetical protein
MFLSKMSLLDSVEHDPKKLSLLVYFGMDAISKSLISEHLQRKKTLQIYYRISVTSVYLSHSMNSSQC